MPNVMVAMPNIGGALCSTPQFGWRPLLDAVQKRCQEAKFAGCPKLANRSQPLVGQSSPYYEDMWRTYRCLTSFFLIVDMCLSCERYSPTKLCDDAQMAIFCVIFASSYFQQAACTRFQTCILTSHQGHTMCGSMVDIQSPTAEIWRGKKRKKERMKEDRNHRAKI